MATLPDEILKKIETLQRQLFQLIHLTTITGYTILERYGETEITRVALNQLQSVRERARTYYTRLYRLLLQIAESDRASSATMELLTQSMEETQAIVDAGAATVTETQSDFNV